MRRNGMGMIVSLSTAAWGFAFIPLHIPQQSKAFAMHVSVNSTIMLMHRKHLTLSRALVSRAARAWPFRYHFVQMVEHLEYTMTQVTDMTLRSSGHT